MDTQGSRLTPLYRTSPVGDPSPKWMFLCLCGATIETRIGLYRSGQTKSCGCLRRETTRERGLANFKHGHHVGGMGSPTIKSWEAMISRCRNPDDKDFYRYGAKGILVCERWSSFPLFLEDMGARPAGKTIDRFPDNQGNYEPGNCRWATPSEQSRNRRVTRFVEFHGETLTVHEALRKTNSGVLYQTALWRIKRGWSVHAALTTEPQGASA